MRRPGIGDLLWVAVAGVVTGVLVVLDPRAGLAEWLFVTVLLSVGAYVVRSAFRAAQLAWREHRRARDLAATEPSAVAMAAIEEERRRLVAEIGDTLRAAVAAINDDVRTLEESDPRPGLARIHRRTQLATTELRRQLGLLRAAASGATEVVEPAPSTFVPRRDAWLAVTVTVLAAAEVAAYCWLDGYRELLPWSPVMSAVAAACVVGRTAAPGAACVLCGFVFALGTLVGAPVMGGFWMLATLGCLVWAATSRRERSWRELAGAAVLGASVAWTRVVDDPDNLQVSVLMVAVAAVGGLTVRLARHLERSSADRAARREEELSEVARTAIAAERSGFARELHDVTSHAVGLIAMQAAAAQVSWPKDPDAVRRSVEVIAATSRSTLAELDRLGTPGSAHRSAGDLRDLVQRIRAAGTPVDLTLAGAVPAEVWPVVHRIVQESLTNVVRHAPGASVRVDVTADGRGVGVRVVDDGSPSGQDAGRGYGLVGLAERVSLAGGSLRTGPSEGGGYAVEATLPVGQEAVVP